MKALDLLHSLVAFSPGLIDGEEDDASGADVVDRIAYLIQNHLDQDERTQLEIVASEVRREMENESVHPGTRI